MLHSHILALHWSCPCNLATRLSLQKLHREIRRARAQSDYQADAFVDASLNDAPLTEQCRRLVACALGAGLATSGALDVKRKKVRSSLRGGPPVKASSKACPGITTMFFKTTSNLSRSE